MAKQKSQDLNLPESYLSIFLGFLVVLIAGIMLANFLTRRNTQESSGQTEEASESQEALAEQETYVVAPRDTLWSIAEKTYGSGFDWPKIALENGITEPRKIEEGQVLVIPQSEALAAKDENILATATKRDEQSATIDTLYTVKKGDSLWSIAVKQYGDGYMWPKIARENHLAYPDVIHTGNTLRLTPQ